MWELKEVDPERVKKIEDSFEVHPALARVLALRVENLEEVRQFLSPQLSDFSPPLSLPDMERSVERIIQAIDGREPILLWGHDDLDGMAGVASLYEILRDLGAEVTYYIPDRTKERHGLDMNRIQTFAQKGVRLLITIDCGITNSDEVNYAKGLKMDVIVTDHHEITQGIPEALGVITTKKPVYPYADLAGCGIALKLCMGLVQKYLGISTKEFLSAKKDLLAFTALGTIADKVPLLGENRVIVKYGLDVLKESRRPVMETLRGVISEPTPQRIVSCILPLFSSAYGGEGVKFLLSKKREEAEEFLSLFSQRNEEWRKEASQALAKARERIEVFDRIVISYDKAIPIRTLGFCASRLRDELHLPAIVIGWRGNEWVGEARGIEGLNLVELLKFCSSELSDYGGHPKAAGFSIKGDGISSFMEKAYRYAEKHFRMPEEKGEMKADAMLPLKELSSEFKDLAPFGEGNPPPLFVSLRTPWAGREMDILYTIDENLRVYIKATTPSSQLQ